MVQAGVRDAMGGVSMGSQDQDRSISSDVAAERIAVAGLETDLVAVVDQMAGCLLARRPMTRELAEQLHDVRRRAEFLFREPA